VIIRNREVLMSVTIPKVAGKGNDILPPLKELLQGIDILGDAPDKEIGVNVLESDATLLTKVWAGIVAGVGGLTAIVTPIASFMNSSSDSVRIMALAGASLALVAMILAIAYIVGTDLKSRTNGAIAIYEARKEITLQFLQEAFSTSRPSKAQINELIAAWGIAPPNVEVKVNGGNRAEGNGAGKPS
jgi:hypothetical protein